MMTIRRPPGPTVLYSLSSVFCFLFSVVCSLNSVVCCHYTIKQLRFQVNLATDYTDYTDFWATEFTEKIQLKNACPEPNVVQVSLRGGRRPTRQSKSPKRYTLNAIFCSERSGMPVTLYPVVGYLIGTRLHI
ncbi:hypothetical protein ES703_105646 [subsurface metagenome]